MSQTLKNRILVENCYLPGDLNAQIEAFVADYSHRCCHESNQGASAPAGNCAPSNPRWS
jgi:hypothetical protein